VREWASWCDDGMIDSIVKDVGTKPQRWDARELAIELNITYELRQRFGFHTISACDKSEEELKALAKEIRRASREAERRAKGVQPRGEWLAAHSDNQTEPWVDLNMSRATYFRRKKAGDAIPPVRDTVSVQLAPRLASVLIATNDNIAPILRAA
jgi:hypothetical protein